MRQNQFFLKWLTSPERRSEHQPRTKKSAIIVSTRNATCRFSKPASRNIKLTSDPGVTKHLTPPGTTVMQRFSIFSLLRYPSCCFSFLRWLLALIAFVKPDGRGSCSRGRLSLCALFSRFQGGAVPCRGKVAPTRCRVDAY